MLTLNPTPTIRVLGMANMIKLHAIRDWANELGVGEPVRQHPWLTRTRLEHPVVVTINRPNPDPTISPLQNISLKAGRCTPIHPYTIQ